MTGKDLLKSMSEIEDSDLERSEALSVRKPKQTVRLVAAAACLVLLIGVGAAFLGKKAPQWIGEGGRYGAGSDSQVKTTVLNLDALPEGTLEPLTRESFDRLVKFAQQIYEEYEEICWMSPKGGCNYCRQEEPKRFSFKPDHETAVAIRKGEIVRQAYYSSYVRDLAMLLRVLMQKSVPMENYTNDQRMIGHETQLALSWYFPDLSKSQYDSAEEIVSRYVYLKQKQPELYCELYPEGGFVKQKGGDCECFLTFDKSIFIYYYANGGREYETIFPTKELRELEKRYAPYWEEMEEAEEKAYQEAVKAYFAENGQ